jgi:hypothetical protein
VAIVVYGPMLAKAAAPRLLPLLAGAWTRAKGIDPGWWSFGKGALLAAVLMLFVGRVEVPWPVIVPPPGPAPGPVVPPVVVPTKGPRTAIIVRESNDDTTAFSEMIDAFRNGPNAEYLRAQGHSLFVLDDDDVDAAGKPLAVLEALKPFSGRELIIRDTKSGKVISRQPCPADANGLRAALEKAGG